MEAQVENAKNVFVTNFAIQPDETVLIVTDDKLAAIARYFYEAAKDVAREVSCMQIPAVYKAGEEPPQAVAAAMQHADIVLCITTASLTHTNARKEASQRGVRVGTMPGITEEMLVAGAITADAGEVIALTAKYTDLLNQASEVRVEKEGYALTFSIAGRQGISSTGIFRQKGESGNIPSGESYVAPLEDSANGQLLVDGSIAGLGKVVQPVLLTLEEGRLVAASGEMGKQLLELLGEGEGRKIAEFGIGTNPAARITGVVLEDEKVFSTIHIAFGSNRSFGGQTEAGVHIDCVVTDPVVYLDGEKIVLKRSED